MKPGERSTLPIPDPHPSGTGWLPQWVTDQLNTNPPIGRRALFTRCRKCKEIVLRGLDADILAMEVTADPTPLDPMQELACVLTGRATYQANVGGDEIKIIDRQLRYTTAGVPPPRPIIPEHVCGRRFPGFIIEPVTQTERAKNPPF